MKWSKLCSSVLLFLISPVQSVNILYLAGVACHSHHFWNGVLINGLAGKGHNVTILSADVEANTNNTHYIHLDNLYPTYFDAESKDSLDYSEMSGSGLLGGIEDFYNFGILGCKGMITSRGFKFLKEYPKDFKFDLIIHDFTIGPCLLGFLEVFNNPPLIGVTPYNNPPFTVHMVGGHKQYAYVPHYLLSFGSEMNLYQRLVNSGLCLIDELYRQFVANTKIGQTMRKGFARRFNDLKALEAKHQLLLVNSHVASDFPESLPPNIIPVGGLHIAETAKALPEDISRFLSKGTKGAILFSIGSIYQGKDLSDDVLTQLINAFRDLSEYQILWKFESNKLNDRISSNVMIKSWLPQMDLLADKRIKVFISHAGLLSTHEAVYHGVPVLALPLISDQHRNAHKLSQDGVALVLNIHSLISSDLVTAVRQLVDDKSFAENMKMKSQIMRDQPERPLERAIWWTEWVLRNPKGHEVLKAPTQRLGFMSANSYDVLLLALLVLVLIPYVVITALVFLGRCMAEKKKPRDCGDNKCKGD